jgi:hypothetical protein
VIGLIILGILGCSKNKFKLTRSQPTDIPYYNLANDSCFVCHNISTLKKTIGNEIVPLYVNRDKFARSIHRANRCVDCHADIVWDNVKKEHPIVPKYYGGWVNFSAEDTIQTRNYTTRASTTCVNCHTGQAGFFSSQHYLIEDIKNSRMDPVKAYDNIEVGKDYDKAKCGKCHLTCATCHFKSVKIRKVYGIDGGEVWDFWSDLLKGERFREADEMTNWAIDWTANVESHDFAAGEELSNSNDLCQVCHTGFYTNYNKTGYYHPDGLSDFDSLVSQGVEKYPKYEERRLIKGDIVVHTGIPSLDSAYESIVNEGVMKEYSCTYCHDRIHSLTPITCKKCHSVSFNKFGYTLAPHLDVACVACHDATMNVWRDPDSSDTVRVAAIKNNKVINWHSHMLVKPDGETTDFCERRCHNPETGRIIGAPYDEPHQGTIHNGDD